LPKKRKSVEKAENNRNVNTYDAEGEYGIKIMINGKERIQFDRKRTRG